MPSLQALTQVRSRKATELLAYLREVADEAARLPPYFPPHLRQPPPGGPLPFDTIRQQLRVIEDRGYLNQIQAQIAEQQRTRNGIDPDRVYSPRYHELQSGNGERKAQNGEDEAREEAIPTTFEWDRHAVRRHRRMVILGDPGYGKSWLLRFEARRWAIDQIQKLEKQQLSLGDLVLPIWMPLDALATGDSLVKNLERKILGGSAPLPRRRLLPLLLEKLNSERCLLLLDAWNEVKASRRADFLERLRKFFTTDYPHPRVLLTSRIVGYCGEPLPGGKEVELLGFDARQSRRVAEAWFRGDQDLARSFRAAVQQQPAIRNQLRIPLLLSLALCTHLYHRTSTTSKPPAAAPYAFPARRVELYEHCLRGLLIVWQEEKLKQEINIVELDDDLARLALAAFQLSERQQELFTESELRAAFGKGKPGKVIERMLEAGVLVRMSDGNGAPLMFLHQTFHEYLTALHLANLADAKGWSAIREIVEAWSWEPERDVILTLLAGLLNDPAPLLDHLADAATDGYFRGRLALAGHCLGEIAKGKRPGLASRIEGILREAWDFIEARATTGACKHMREAFLAILSDRNYPQSMTAATGSIAPSIIISRLSDFLLQKPDVSQLFAIKALGQVKSDAAALRLFGRVWSWSCNTYDIGYFGRDDNAKFFPSLRIDLRPIAKNILLSILNGLGIIGTECATSMLIYILEYKINYFDEYSSVFLEVFKYNIDTIRCSILESLLMIGSERALSAVIDNPLNCSYAYLQNSIERISYSDVIAGDINEIAEIPRLLRTLSHGKVWERRTSAMALRRFESDAVIPGLITALRDSDQCTRSVASESLVEIGSDSVVSALLAKSRLCAESIYVLGEIGSPSIIPRLMAELFTIKRVDSSRSLVSVRDSRIIYSIVLTLAKIAIASEHAKQAILEIIDTLQLSTYGAEAYIVCKILAKIGSEGSISKLIDLIVGRDTDLFKTTFLHMAFSAIAKNHLVNFEPWLKELLSMSLSKKPKYEPTQMEAAKVLGEIGSSAGENFFITILQEKYQKERVKPLPNYEYSLLEPTVVALGKLRAENSVSLLISMLKKINTLDTNILYSKKDKYYDYKFYYINRLRECAIAAKALGEIGSPSAVDALISQLGKDYHMHSERTKTIIAKALGKTGSEKALTAILNMEGSLENEVFEDLPNTAFFRRYR